VRLEKYEKHNAPLIEHYRSKGALATFTGDTSDVIYPQIKGHLLALGLSPRV
jgi:adenylate kinase family enzyme